MKRKKNSLFLVLEIFFIHDFAENKNEKMTLSHHDLLASCAHMININIIITFTI